MSTKIPSYAKYSATAAAVIAMGAVLVGCSGGGATAPGVDASGRAEWSLTVDGEKVQVADAVVACTEDAGKVMIAIASQDTAGGGEGIGAVLEQESLTVETVTLGSGANGQALGYAAGVPDTEATATKDGSTYTITGTAASVDMANPMAGPETKKFDMSVTCP